MSSTAQLHCRLRLFEALSLRTMLGGMYLPYGSSPARIFSCFKCPSQIGTRNTCPANSSGTRLNGPKILALRSSKNKKNKFQAKTSPSTKSAGVRQSQWNIHSIMATWKVCKSRFFLNRIFPFIKCATSSLKQILVTKTEKMIFFLERITSCHLFLIGGCQIEDRTVSN